MKKARIIPAVIIAVVMSLSLVSFAGCGGSGNELSFENAFDCSVIGGIGLLGQTSTESVRRASAPYAESEETLTQAEKDTIIKNLAVANGTLGGDTVKSEVKASEREGYAWHYTLSAKDAEGKTQTYEFFYNEVLKDSDEDEEEADIFGIALFDGTEYTVSGERETEIDEQEYKFEIKLDENNYVVIEQEMSNEDGEYEHEFKYILYKDGVKVYETEVEYEVEDGEIELKFKTESNGVKTEYKYEMYTEGGEHFIKVKLADASGKIKAKIKVTHDADGTAAYEFVK